MTPVTLKMLMREQAKMIGRMADMEKRITGNADKAHEKIGSNIANLGKEVAEIGKIVSATDSKVDTLHEWMKEQNRRITDLEVAND